MGSGVIYNIAMVVEYDGSNFFGFQKQQASTRTIQGELEAALSKFAGEAISIVTAGRTDTGVHALYQVINFSTLVKRELHSWVRGVNALLPKDIVIHETQVVNNEFNARFSAISRTYNYYLLVSPVRPALLYKKIGWYYGQLDIEKMSEAGNYLVGEQDFSSFRASECQALNPVRNLTNFNLSARNNILRFEITANAFLYHMVRNIVGALVYVGNGKLAVSGFKDLITACDRKLAPPTFCADGLYLTNINYQQNPFNLKNAVNYFDH